MTGYYVRVREDGRHQVYEYRPGHPTTDVPHADYSKPKEAIDYALMREAAVSPVRDPVEGLTDPFPVEPSAGSLTRTSG